MVVANGPCPRWRYEWECSEDQPNLRDLPPKLVLTVRVISGSRLGRPSKIHLGRAPGGLGDVG